MRPSHWGHWWDWGGSCCRRISTGIGGAWIGAPEALEGVRGIGTGSLVALGDIHGLRKGSGWGPQWHRRYLWDWDGIPNGTGGYPWAWDGIPSGVRGMQGLEGHGMGVLGDGGRIHVFGEGLGWGSQWHWGGFIGLEGHGMGFPVALVWIHRLEGSWGGVHNSTGGFQELGMRFPMALGGIQGLGWGFTWGAQWYWGDPGAWRGNWMGFLVVLGASMTLRGARDGAPHGTWGYPWVCQGVPWAEDVVPSSTRESYTGVLGGTSVYHNTHGWGAFGAGSTHDMGQGV